MAWLILPPTLIINLLLLMADRCESYPRMHRAVPFRERYPQAYPKLYAQPQQYAIPPATAYEETLPEYGEYYEPRDPFQDMSDQQLAAMLAYNDQGIIREDPYYGFPAEPEMAPEWYANSMQMVPNGYLQDQQFDGGYQQYPMEDNYMQIPKGYYSPEIEAVLDDVENRVEKKDDDDELVKEIDALKGSSATESPEVVTEVVTKKSVTTAPPTPEATTMASEARGQKEVPLYRPPNPSRKVIHVQPTLPGDHIENKKNNDGDVYATIRRYLRNDKKRQIRSDEQLTHLMKKRFIHQRAEENIVSSDKDLPQQLSKLKGVMA